MYKNFCWNPEGREPHGRRRCKWQNTIKWGTDKQNLRMWAVFNCRRVEANGGLLWQFNVAITI